jgi:diguanylate cyclase (GGDEF)-like protein
MTGRSDDQEDSWQARTHVIRVSPTAKPKDVGGDCLVIIYARDTSHLGKRFMLDGAPECWVGRGSDNAIMLESDTCSRRHAHFERRGDAWWVVDNHSTNGTYVNDSAVESQALRRGDHVKVGDTIFKYLAGSDVEAEFIQTIGAIMVTDGLTQVNNRRALTEQLEKELQRARRYKRPLALIMFDLDFFKRVNDTHGHLAGDYVLRETASVVKARVPRDATFARYGGEEFSILLPETDLATAAALAEDVRKAVEQHEFRFDQQKIPVTISMGVALATESMHAAEEFIKAADTKLYAAKHGGRNQVVS